MKHEYLILEKGEDKYLFRYTDKDVEKLYSTLLGFAEDEQLNLRSCEVLYIIAKLKKERGATGPKHSSARRRQ